MVCACGVRGDNLLGESDGGRGIVNYKILVAPVAGFIVGLAIGLLLDGGGDDGGQAPTVLPTPTAGVAAPTLAPTQVPTATVPPEPTATPEPATHTVESGQTLTIIADLYNTSVDVLVELNDLASPDQLEVGQVLILPPQTPETP